MPYEANLYLVYLFVVALLLHTRTSNNIIYLQLHNHPSSGKPQYLQSPFVTAGDRVYMVGHQDGSFPDLGWHVTGEMGGIWNHPIKLMDGFTASLTAKRSGKVLLSEQCRWFYKLSNWQPTSFYMGRRGY
jgi:hypothetical protein